MSRDLVKVAGERRQRNGPMSIRLFSPSTGTQTQVTLPTLNPMYGFSVFHFSTKTKQKQKHAHMYPGKSFKGINNIQTATFPHLLIQSCMILLVGEGFETRPQVAQASLELLAEDELEFFCLNLLNAGIVGVWHCALTSCN